MTDIGIRYLRGEGVVKNSAVALGYFIRADAAGDMKAARHAGLSYERGQGTAINYNKAFAFYAKAAASRDTTRECLLGSLYERGLGVRQDYDRAADLYGQASQPGDRVASGTAAALGNLYETRTDGKQNLATALKWYRTAAHQQDPGVAADLQRLALLQPLTIPPGRNLCLSPLRGPEAMRSHRRTSLGIRE